MSKPVLMGEVDLLGMADLRELALERPGPCVSVLLPTHRGGPQTRQDPIRLRNLLDEASTRLASSGLESRQREELLAPHRALLDDRDFWRYLSDGLVLYCAPGFHRRYRVPLPFVEEVAVGLSFRLGPLLPLLAGDGHFFVLGLSQNQVKLYEATRSTIAELPVGSIPASMAEALAHEDPEAQLQVRTGGEAGMYHGHGQGDEVDKQVVERYFRAVDRALVDRIGADRRTPLVLAAVGYYLPIYAAVTEHPALVDRAVKGNPENRSARELHASAWDVVAPRFEAARRDSAEALRQAEGTGMASSDIVSVVQAALEGRIATLFLAGTSPVWGRAGAGSPPSVELHADQQRGDDDLLDRAAAETLLAGGAVYVGEQVPSAERTPVAARFRW